MLPEFLRNPPGGKPWLLLGAVGLSLALNLGLALRLAKSEPAVATGPVGALADVPASIPVIGEATDVSNAPIPPDQVAPLPEPLGVATQSGTHVFSGVVQSSISATFTGVTQSSPAALSAVYTRLFAWDLDMRRDLHKGDRVEVLFEQHPNQEPLVLAARFVSQPDSATPRTFTAYRWQAPGDRFPSYWAPDGAEIPKRLVAGPLADYEQVTSLLKDRPSHEGMDFKTFVGTEVTAPRAGKVTRTNWNHAANGNCIELQFADGATAKFLHLNENLVKEGQSVSAGTPIGKTGNTGRSTGPHLHYQIERGGNVIDPVSYHGTLRRQLPADVLPRFQADIKPLESQLSARVASAL